MVIPVRCIFRSGRPVYRFARIDSLIYQLVQAMAAYAPPPLGQMTLPDNYASSLAPVLASWH